MTDVAFEEVWRRIVAHVGESFTTKRGLPFSYHVAGDGPAAINAWVRGPAYVWAVLHDPRIRRRDW